MYSSIMTRHCLLKLAEVHKDTMHGLFGLTMTPEEVANTLEEATKKIL